MSLPACPGLGEGAGKTLDWKQDRTWVGDPLICGHSAPTGPASAAGHRVLQRSCALGLWQGTISRWVGPGLIVGLTPHLPVPKIAFGAGRRLADSFNKATGRVGSCARSSAVGQCEAVSLRLHRLSTQGILLAGCGTEDARQAGGRSPACPACPALSSASDRKLIDPLLRCLSAMDEIMTAPWILRSSCGVRIALRDVYCTDVVTLWQRCKTRHSSGRVACTLSDG